MEELVYSLVEPNAVCYSRILRRKITGQNFKIEHTLQGFSEIYMLHIEEINQSLMNMTVIFSFSVLFSKKFGDDLPFAARFGSQICKRTGYFNARVCVKGNFVRASGR